MTTYPTVIHLLSEKKAKKHENLLILKNPLLIPKGHVRLSYWKGAGSKLTIAEK
jgi:hypothetical protein